MDCRLFAESEVHYIQSCRNHDFTFDLSAYRREFGALTILCRRVPINSGEGIQCRLVRARLSNFQLQLTDSLVNTIAKKGTVAETGATASKKKDPFDFSLQTGA